MGWAADTFDAWWEWASAHDGAIALSVVGVILLPFALAVVLLSVKAFGRGFREGFSGRRDDAGSGEGDQRGRPEADFPGPEQDGRRETSPS